MKGCPIYSYNTEDFRRGGVLRTARILASTFPKESPETLFAMAEIRSGPIEAEETRRDLVTVLAYVMKNRGLLLGVGDIEVCEEAKKAVLLNCD